MSEAKVSRERIGSTDSEIITYKEGIRSRSVIRKIGSDDVPSAYGGLPCPNIKQPYQAWQIPGTNQMIETPEQEKAYHAKHGTIRLRELDTQDNLDKKYKKKETEAMLRRTAESKARGRLPKHTALYNEVGGGAPKIAINQGEN